MSYHNVSNLPMFGYGAKTSKLSTKPAPIFPISRSIRDPFTPNDDETIDISYQAILEQIEMTLPVNLNPLLMFFKQLGVHVKTRLEKKATSDVRYKNVKNSIDCVYVLYVLSTGLIDDIQSCLATLR
jgi:hypothetical protein